MNMSAGDQERERTKLVLIVDDDEAIRDVIMNALSDVGYEVVVARGGETALLALQSRRPDLILLDVNMPGVDGWEVLDQLRAEAGPHQPIVIMTGQYNGQQRALSSGAQGYLAKPFDLDDLFACVELHSGIRMTADHDEALPELGR